jgi:RNA polymerase sigma-70 factor (ECF subfamily)
MTMHADPVAAALRDALAPATAALVRAIGDLDLADDMIQEAAIAALERWPVDGPPERPDRWLLAVARHRAIDRFRREANLQDKLAGIERAALQTTDDVGDDWLSLLFTCCHPALAREAQVALTLRAVCGLTVTQIAAAFLTSEATIAQRIVRAKRKIARAGVTFRVPAPEHLASRLDEVLAVLYLMFNEGYLSTDGDGAERPDLAESAEWLTDQLAQLMPREPEVLGLLALIRLHRARGATRFDVTGRLLPLRRQDRSRWDHRAIAAAADLVVRASRLLRPGPYQLQAAIVACHAEAPTWEHTDWLQILVLYDELLRHAPTPVTRLNRAIALRYVAGPEAALAEIHPLAGPLDGYHLFHATRAELLRDLQCPEEARRADRRALALTANPAERSLLEQRLG